MLKTNLQKVETKVRRENLVQIPSRSLRLWPKVRGRARERCMNLVGVRRNRKRVMRTLMEGRHKRSVCD